MRKSSTAKKTSQLRQPRKLQCLTPWCRSSLAHSVRVRSFDCMAEPAQWGGAVKFYSLKRWGVNRRQQDQRASQNGLTALPPQYKTSSNFTFLCSRVLPTCTLQVPTAKMSSDSASDTPAGERDGEVPKSPIYGNNNGAQVSEFDTQASLKSRSKRSLRAHHPASERRPIDKFRSTVNKVMAMKRSTTILAAVGAGAEPGIDPRRASMEIQYRSVQKVHNKSNGPSN